jgi:hypothetical protein
VKEFIGTQKNYCFWFFAPCLSNKSRYRFLNKKCFPIYMLILKGSNVARVLNLIFGHLLFGFEIVPIPYIKIGIAPFAECIYEIYIFI